MIGLLFGDSKQGWKFLGRSVGGFEFRYGLDSLPQRPHVPVVRDMAVTLQVILGFFLS